MSDFFLSKNVAKIGDTVDIFGSCVNSGSLFFSSDGEVANMYTGTTIIATNKGITEISEITVPATCDNTGSILLTVTEDGNPPLISVKDYQDFSAVELVFVCFMLVMAFFIYLGRRF